MRPLLLPPRRSDRVVEATPDQVIATGAAGSTMGDPVDQERGWRPAGSRGRDVPYWTLEKARIYSVAAYRSNPMARAIIDTYTSFCVGDAGVTYEVSNPQVQHVVDEFWEDPANNLGGSQELGLRSMLLLGETVRQVMTGPLSGVVRWAPIDPASISEVGLHHGNPLWPSDLVFRTADIDTSLTVVRVDDATGLRDGQALFWTPFKTIETDVRSMPFLTPILDWLDSYDTVLSNLIDHTALARYLVWDVTVKGGQTEVDDFVKARGGQHVPRSGSVEVHNDAVEWKPQKVETGAVEDSVTAQNVLTQVAGGSGLAKHWLAEPENANRATSQTMAEPVRRRVGGVQKVWLGYQTELVRFATDRAVAAKRLPARVQATNPRTGDSYDVAPSRTVTLHGPEVAAADAQITAQVMLNLATGLEKLVDIKALTPEASAVAARKAWEDYTGTPWRAELGKSSANPDDVATAIDAKKKANLRAV